MSLYIGERINHLNRKCPICNSNEAKKMCNISYVLPEGNPLPAQYDVVCCIKCGFAYANVDANQDAYNDYYANYNMYSENAQLKLSGGGQKRREGMESQSDSENNSTRCFYLGCGMW